MRSFQLNDEASLNVYDSTFARQVTDAFERDAHWQSRCWPLKAAEIVLIPIRSQL
jgi:cardiolipin synthase